MNIYGAEMLVADRQRRYMEEARTRRFAALARRGTEQRQRVSLGFVKQVWAAVRPTGTLAGGPTTVVVPASPAIGV